MPAPSPRISSKSHKALQELGEQIRIHRKRLGISATVAAEAAEISRVTQHRIERGEPSVAMGAYLNVVASLGLEFKIVEIAQASSPIKSFELPEKIEIALYPQLKALSWQLKKGQKISPKEAFQIYERNWRSVDLRALSSPEKKLLETLIAVFGRGRLLV